MRCRADLDDAIEGLAAPIFPAPCALREEPFGILTGTVGYTLDAS